MKLVRLRQFQITLEEIISKILLQPQQTGTASSLSPSTDRVPNSALSLGNTVVFASTKEEESALL